MGVAQPGYFGAERCLADLHGPTGVGFTGDRATAGVVDAARLCQMVAAAYLRHHGLIVSALRLTLSFQYFWRVNPRPGEWRDLPGGSQRRSELKASTTSLRATFDLAATSMPTWCQFAIYQLRDSLIIR